MKTFPSLLASLVLLTASATHSFAAHPSRSHPAHAFNVGVVNTNSDQQITRGTVNFSVRQILGSPDRILSRDTWVYYNRGSDHPETAKLGCTTLVVTFDREYRVADLKLVNPTATRIIANNVRQGKAHYFVAADSLKQRLHVSGE